MSPKPKDKLSMPPESEFRIAATDTKGHSTRHYFRTIPMMASLVQQIVESREFPYRRKGDLLRHALHRHVKWLATLAPIPTVMGQVEIILEILREQEMNRDFSNVFTQLEERIEAHRKGGENNEAARLVLVILTHIEDMPDGFWKGKYQERMKVEYGELLKKAKRANLGAIE